MENNLNQTVHSHLFFRKVVDIEPWASSYIRAAILHECQTAISAILSRRSHEKTGDCEQSKVKCSLVKLFDMSYSVPLFTTVFPCGRLVKHPRNYCLYISPTMPGYALSSSDQQCIGEKYKCNSCHLVLRDAMQTGCGHFYCSSCLRSLYL